MKGSEPSDEKLYLSLSHLFCDLIAEWDAWEDRVGEWCDVEIRDWAMTWEERRWRKTVEYRERPFPLTVNQYLNIKLILFIFRIISIK